MAGLLLYVSDSELTKAWLANSWPAIPLSVRTLPTDGIHTEAVDGRPETHAVEVIAWNTFLAVFSIIAFVGFAPSGLFNELANGGFIHSICTIEPFSTPQLCLWSTLFVLSKFVEFGDTFILIFRKSQLTFLHVYHYVTVAMYTWFGGMDRSSVGHWFYAMNYGVHSIMYTYFTLKAMGVQLPSMVASTITSLQLCQFFMGLVCVMIAAVHLWLGMLCNNT